MDIFIVAATYTVERDVPRVVVIEGAPPDFTKRTYAYTMLKTVVAPSASKAKGLVRDQLLEPNFTVVSTMALSLAEVLGDGYGEGSHLVHPDVLPPPPGREPELREALALARKWMGAPETAPPMIHQPNLSMPSRADLLNDIDRVDWIVRKWGVEEEPPEGPFERDHLLEALALGRKWLGYIKSKQSRHERQCGDKQQLELLADTRRIEDIASEWGPK